MWPEFNSFFVRFTEDIFFLRSEVNLSIRMQTMLSCNHVHFGIRSLFFFPYQQNTLNTFIVLLTKEKIFQNLTKFLVIRLHSLCILRLLIEIQVEARNEKRILNPLFRLHNINYSNEHWTGSFENNNFDAGKITLNFNSAKKSTELTNPSRTLSNQSINQCIISCIDRRKRDKERP